MEPIKILIVEQNLAQNKSLQNFLEGLGYQVGFCLNDAAKYINLLTNNPPDLVLVDLVEKGFIGTQSLVETCHWLKIPYLFTFFGQSNNIDLSKQNPFAFIAKPLGNKTFQSFTESVLRSLGTKGELPENTGDSTNGFLLKDHFFIKKNNRLLKVPTKHILFVQSMGNYCSISTKDTKYIIRKSLSKLEALFPSDDFVRVHKQFMVRVDAVLELEKTELELLVEGHVIPIGRKYKDNLFSRLIILS